MCALRNSIITCRPSVLAVALRFAISSCRATSRGAQRCTSWAARIKPSQNFIGLGFSWNLTGMNWDPMLFNGMFMTSHGDLACNSTALTFEHDSNFSNANDFDKTGVQVEGWSSWGWGPHAARKLCGNGHTNRRLVQGCRWSVPRSKRRPGIREKITEELVEISMAFHGFQWISGPTWLYHAILCQAQSSRRIGNSWPFWLQLEAFALAWDLRSKHSKSRYGLSCWGGLFVLI